MARYQSVSIDAMTVTDTLRGKDIVSMVIQMDGLGLWENALHGRHSTLETGADNESLHVCHPQGKKGGAWGGGEGVGCFINGMLAPHADRCMRKWPK